MNAMLLKKKIVLTGGGTAGHVTPNLALAEQLLRDGWDVHYIGSPNGIEQNMARASKLPYHGVSSGKLRRYFSWQNFFDPFKILMGIFQSYFLLRKLKADVVFSKGGFVAFPVVVGAWLNRIPVIAHESDMSPGLANRLSFPFVTKICVTFASARQHFKQQDKVELTGTPLRASLFQGDPAKGLKFCGFHEAKPCLLVIGGSQGASAMNQVIRDALDDLCQSYQVIHLCGRGKIDPALKDKPAYCQLEYANEELGDLFAASELVISRAGANSLYELLALNKPHVLVPLSAKVSRGDQLLNADYFKQQGISIVIQEEALNQTTLFSALDEIRRRRLEIVHRIQALQIHSATKKIIHLIESVIS